MAGRNTILFERTGIHPSIYPKTTANFAFKPTTSHFTTSVNKISLGHPARVSSYAVVEGSKLAHRGFRSQNFAALVKARIPKHAAWELSHRKGFVEWNNKGLPVVRIGDAKRAAKRLA